MQLVHAPIGRLSPDKTGHVPDMSGMSGQQICIPLYTTQLRAAASRRAAEVGDNERSRGGES
jgi:hypothetical protein